MSGLNLITKGSLLLHITIICTCAVWCNYERRPCEEKTVCNCEASGYSTNNALWQQCLGIKNKLSIGDKNGLRKEMYIQTQRQNAYMQWGVNWFPKRIVYNTAITAPLLHSLQHGTFHLGVGRPEPHFPAGVIVTLNKVIPPHLLSPPMWPRVRIHVTLRYGRGVGFMGSIRHQNKYNDKYS